MGLVGVEGFYQVIGEGRGGEGRGWGAVNGGHGKVCVLGSKGTLVNGLCNIGIVLQWL